MTFQPDGSVNCVDEHGNENGKLAGWLPAESVLLEVTEFDGKRKVPPPTSHLGNAIEPKPLIAANLGLLWLEKLVALAAALQASSP